MGALNYFLLSSFTAILVRSFSIVAGLQATPFFPHREHSPPKVFLTQFKDFIGSLLITIEYHRYKV